MVLPLVASPTVISGPSIAAALEVSVANIANPTELNALGTAVPDWRLCRTNVAGSDEATLYRLDADTDAVAAPYVMASATAGLRWVAIAGRYMKQAVDIAATGGVGLNVYGAAATFGSSPDLRLKYTGDNDAVFSFFGYNHNNIALVFDSYFNGAAWVASDPTAYHIYKSAGVLNFFGSSGLTKGNTYALSATSMVLGLNTTAASSSITGTLVIGNGATAATNVGIGGGAIYAGASIFGSGDNNPSSPNGSIVARNSGSLTKAVYMGVANAADWYFVQAADSSGPTFKNLQLNPSGANVLIGTNAATGLGTNGCLRVAGTTSAASSITGTIVIGDASTAATNVGIGGGNINAGGAITAGGALTVAYANAVASINATSGSTNLFFSLAGAQKINLACVSAAVPYAVYDPVNLWFTQQYNAGTAATGSFLFNGTLDATSTVTGAVQVSGGIGVAKRLCLDGATGKTLRITNGVANAAVAVTFGAVGPTGSTAGNAQGWMRVDINGTDRYIPYW